MQARWIALRGIASRGIALCGVAALASVAHAEPEATAKEPRLAAGVRLEAAGKLIDVAIGHAAPFVVDWNQDGHADLLVGEFGGGQLHVFHGSGGAGAPTLAASAYVEAEGQKISVPSG